MISVPVAYLFSRHIFFGKNFFDTLLDLPIVLSPIALGAMLLIFFSTPLGRQVDQRFGPFVFEVKGIILAQFLVVVGLSIRLLSVCGSVEKSLNLSLADLKAMDPLCIKAVAVLKEKQNQTDKEELIEVADYRGALLRDVLLKAGMVHKRKYEPAVFIRVKGWTREVVFSFGEIFYSSIGRSTLLVYEKNGKPITASTGCPELIVSNDIREGRRISGVSQIIVERIFLPE